MLTAFVCLLFFYFPNTNNEMAPGQKQMQSIAQVGMLALHYTSENGGRLPQDIETLQTWASRSEYNINQDDKIWIYYDVSPSTPSSWLLGSSINDPILVKAPRPILSRSGKILRLVYHRVNGKWMPEYVEE